MRRPPAARSPQPTVGTPPPSRPASRRGWALALWFGSCLWGCTAADNLNYTEITTELDGIATFVGTGPSRQVRGGAEEQGAAGRQ